MEKNIYKPTGLYLIIFLFITVYCPCLAQNKDIDLLRDINLNRNKSLDKGMISVTNSVYPVSALLPLAELAAGYKKHDTLLIRHGWQTAAGLALNFTVTFGLKYAVNRPRPYVTYPILEPYLRDKDGSFPSGHTSFAFNTATSVVILCPRWYVVVPAYAWAGTVVYSRLHLGRHYPSDVLGGAIVGTGTALLALKGNKWLQHRKNKKHTTVGH